MEASASFGHNSLAQFEIQVLICYRQREREKSGTSFGEDYLYWFELSLDIVLAIYDK
jgi:hypothetical protein